MLQTTILMSINPKYAIRILNGMKTVELRKVCPKRINKKTTVLIYASYPMKSLVGTFRVEKVEIKPLNELWEIVYKRAGVSRNEFDNYYYGVSTGVAIFFRKMFRIPNPIKLETLKKELNNFNPPQSFRYLTENEKQMLWSPFMEMSE